jgi:hypothetical protein
VEMLLQLKPDTYCSDTTPVKSGQIEAVLQRNRHIMLYFGDECNTLGFWEREGRTRICAFILKVRGKNSLLLQARSDPDQYSVGMS